MRGLLNFFRHIRVRLTLWYVVLLALVLIAFSSILYFSLKSGLLNEVDDSLARTAAQLATNLEMENGHLSFQNSDEPGNLLDKLAAQGYAVRLTYQDGETIQEAGEHPALFESKENPEKGFETVSTAGTDWRVCTIEKSIAGGKASVFLQLGESLERVESTLSELVILEIIIIPVLLVLASAGGTFLAGRALNPVKKITRLADSTEAVDLSRRLDLDLPNDEIGMLARTFNGMLDRLEEAFGSQKRFVSEAAHELRTPLTVMKGTTDVALGRARTAEEYRESLEEVKGEIEHLASVVEDLLALSRADSDSAVMDLQYLDLSKIARKTVERVSPLAEEKDIVLDFSSRGCTQVLGDAGKLTRMLTNLLDNAVKYTPVRGRVSVLVAESGDEVQASIRDNGPGIPEGEQGNIFRRFHRLEEGRQIDPSGAGLGLSIALWVARAHGGDIRVVSSPGQGATFHVVLPKAQAGP